ncbi:hypothetical protein llap_8554 [Limosa lapponica baueri]|uniref:Glycerol kinase n=1 Tax=Limosa lapponica baueri TaxID=1758121 RepID=A0A2I0U537_LIMLA|nr:hypothetical protein llap_8554 [Limosa lapponica baueri]
MLDLVLTNKEGLVGNVKLKGSLGYSDHEMVQFKILRAARRAHSKVATLDFGRADFGLFGDLLSRVPWDKALERRGAHESWLSTSRSIAYTGMSYSSFDNEHHHYCDSGCDHCHDSNLDNEHHQLLRQ